MSLRWTVGLLVYLLPGVAPMPTYAQIPPSAAPAFGITSPSVTTTKTHKKVRAKYDSTADSTHWSVVTHKGKYFLTWQRPRLTWSVAHAGRELNGQSPREVLLEFRTQEPQAAMDSRLVITSGGGEQLEVGSLGARSDPGVVTWSHFMRFGIPCAELAGALASEDVTVSVGGIREHLKPDQVRALRSLLDRVGAWPPPQSHDAGLGE
jgi:hypothetical protein